MVRSRLSPALMAVGLALALVGPATAQSVPGLGDRIVPEPLERATYVSHAEFGGYLDAFAERYPRFTTTGSLGESEEGRDLTTFELTDAESPVPYADRGVVFVAQSIHANEPGGREGMLRVAEDLLVEAAAGDENTLDALTKLRIVQAIPNVDSWVSGDLGVELVPRYFRENANGVDLNRQLPWPGRINPARDYTTEAESRAMVADADARREAGERVVGTADVHGMLQNQSAVWTMYSSGQFDLGGWVRQIEMAAAIDTRVREALGPIELLREVTGATTGQLVTPHRTTTSSEFQGGLSGSGFYGDWLAQAEGLDSPSVSTIELFVNNGPAGTYNQATYVAPVVQAHVDSVRAIVRGMVAIALVEHEVRVTPPGRVGVVVDPTVVVDDSPERRTPDAEVTPMRFFDHLDPYLDAPTVRLDVDEVTTDTLDDLAVVVVPSDVAVTDAGAMAALRAFVTSGGTAVLTDTGLAALPAIDDRFGEGDVARSQTMIGNATFTDLDHPLADGLRTDSFERPLHTYEPSTLGYNTEGGSGQAPVWHVDRGRFEGAGGATVATTGGQTSIGELAVGSGTLRVIGGLLPLPTTQNQPRYGLANYAPNDTGYLVFTNAMGASLEVTEVPATFGPGDGDDDEDAPRGRRPDHAGTPGPPPHAGPPSPRPGGGRQRT